MAEQSRQPAKITLLTNMSTKVQPAVPLGVGVVPFGAEVAPRPFADCRRLAESVLCYSTQRLKPSQYTRDAFFSRREAFLRHALLFFEGALVTHVQA